MKKQRRASKRLGLLASTLLLLWAALAWAFPLDIEVISKVALGKNPELVVHALDNTKKAQINLTRDDGRKFVFPVGHLNAGAKKAIQLDGREGRHEYTGNMVALVAGEEVSVPVSFKTVVAGPLKLQVNKSSLDLEKGTLQFTANRAVALARLKIIGVDGGAIFEEITQLKTAPGSQLIPLSWRGVSADDIVRIELRVEDIDGFFTGVALTPWSVEIPHEEVLFATNSAEIDKAQEPKLQSSAREIKAALKRFSQIEGVQLFIAGHTDTVGSPHHNQKLSRKRARSIASWFVSHGIPLRVSYEGFGESSPKVKTGDEKDEPQNRRVDYILSVEAPTLRSSAHQWKRLN